VTANWPTKYRARFWSHGLLPYRVAAVQFSVGTLKSSRNLLAVVGVLVAAVGVGALIGAASGFPLHWPVFVLIAVLIVIAGGLSAIMSYPHRSGMFDWYRPGTESQIAIAEGVLMLSLNSHLLKLPVDDVVKVWRFGGLSAIESSSTRSVVIPTAFVPHRSTSGGGPEIIARWGKPAG
jgi:hypothetical protein